MNASRKIFAVVLLLAASIAFVPAQNLANYRPRGTNPDLYNTNRDGTLPPTGGALPKTSPKAKSNEKKNRWKMPNARDFDSRVTLAAMLAPGDDRTRFSDGRAARITGFVTECKTSGSARRPPPKRSGESCNNGATHALDTDAHIDVVIRRADRNIKTRHIVVEVTPRVRELMRRRGIDWTTSVLRPRIKDQWVEFEGWLFWDLDHEDEARNTDPRDREGARNWRASAWEIHPVTNIRVLPGPPQNAREPAPRPNRRPPQR